MPRNALLLVLLLLLSACQGNKSSVGLTERFVVTDRLPSQQIRAFAEDSRGYVWIGTYGALCRYNGQTYNQYFMDDDSLANRNFSVNCLMADESENLWIGTIGGLYCFRYGPGFTKVSDEYAHIICDSPTGYILFDNMSSVWRVDKKTMEVTEFHSYDSGTQTYGHIITDKFGKCWICDGEELTCKDIVSGDIEARVGIRGTVQSALSVGNNIFLFTDMDFFCLDPYSKRLAETGEFHRVYEELKSEEIGGMFPLNDNSFFIYTKEPKLYVYSSKGIRVWSSDKLSLLSYEINHEYELSTLFIDSKKNFWIGTEHDGFQTFSSRQTMFVDDNALKSAFNDKCVTSLHSDSNGDILIVADGKNLFRYDRNGRITQIKRNSNEEIVGLLSCKDGLTYLACTHSMYAGQLRGEQFDVTAEWQIQAKAIAEDMEGNVYVRTLNGPLLMKASDNGEFRKVNVGEGEMKIVKLQCLHDGRMAMLDANRGIYFLNEEPVGLGIGEDIIYTDFCEDEKGNLWLSTYGRGIVSVDPVTGQSSQYLNDEYCHEVLSIIEDNWGNIWMGTNNGLTRYQPSTGKFLTFYENVGIASNEFCPRSALLTSDNRLMFGSIKGITYFSPEQISPVRQERLMMEYLTVNGEHIQDLTTDDEVHLPYNNAAVDISFTTLQYGESASSYQYQMEGFDPTVTSIRGTEHAYYTHLPQGKYTFRVKVSGSTDKQSEQTVRIIVHPDFGGLPVMKWLVYPLLGILVFLFALWVAYKRNLLRQRLLSAEYDTEQERKLNELNMRFFSNISHEFRTPLTLINGALSMIKSGGDDRLHEIMRQNTGRMLRLVNQLMDFNKLEGGMLRLSVSKTDVSQLLRDIMSMFEATLKRLNIEFSLLLPDEPVVTLIDADKFEKVMVNLVSNAVKYSGEGSKLTVRLSVSDDKQLRVDVADTGIGIPEDKREAIFGRFYQLKQAGQLPAIGTGVGLYYTRSLVELHHGKISCSANEPKGSVFSFTLPMNEDAYSKDERQTSVQFVSDEPSRFAQDVSEEVSDGQESHTYKLMVVDDDHDVLSFLQLLLSPHYEVYTFTDATKAYQEIEAIEPDLILSDVMMYQIDGYKFCQMIKDNSSICHIPVVLLTAKSTMAEQIHGLDCGASAYVTKPFSPDYLLAMLKSQLENVRYIQQALNTTTKVEEKEEKFLEEADRKLMQSFYDFFEEHLSDPVLQVDELTKYLGMSRTKVFYKLKGLTGDTPSAFFKTYKLNRAAEMILQGNEKIAYIADVTGFSSTSHFSTSFKKQFNCSPSEYKEVKSEK